MQCILSLDTFHISRTTWRIVCILYFILYMNILIQYSFARYELKDYAKAFWTKKPCNWQTQGLMLLNGKWRSFRTSNNVFNEFWAKIWCVRPKTHFQSNSIDGPLPHIGSLFQSHLNLIRFSNALRFETAVRLSNRSLFDSFSIQNWTLFSLSIYDKHSRHPWYLISDGKREIFRCSRMELTHKSMGEKSH